MGNKGCGFIINSQPLLLHNIDIFALEGRAKVYNKLG
ncbi:hypothetical protein BACCAC_03198 [Bacteroides caccae ATCC 43185]|nr:hypothetical protein BACCAC_03198 [Bacteroides caccae ATCC 43185]